MWYFDFRQYMKIIYRLLRKSLQLQLDECQFWLEIYLTHVDIEKNTGEKMDPGKRVKMECLIRKMDQLEERIWHYTVLIDK